MTSENPHNIGIETTSCTIHFSADQIYRIEHNPAPTTKFFDTLPVPSNERRSQIETTLQRGKKLRVNMAELACLIDPEIAALCGIPVSKELQCLWPCFNGRIQTALKNECATILSFIKKSEVSLPPTLPEKSPRKLGANSFRI